MGDSVIFLRQYDRSTSVQSPRIQSAYVACGSLFLETRLRVSLIGVQVGIHNRRATRVSSLIQHTGIGCCS